MKVTSKYDDDRYYNYSRGDVFEVLGYTIENLYMSRDGKDEFYKTVYMVQILSDNNQKMFMKTNNFEDEDYIIREIKISELIDSPDLKRIIDRKLTPSETLNLFSKEY